MTENELFYEKYLIAEKAERALLTMLDDEERKSMESLLKKYGQNIDDRRKIIRSLFIGKMELESNGGFGYSVVKTQQYFEEIRPKENTMTSDDLDF